MKYFISGGAGFIGSHLASKLSDRGEVRCYDNLTSGRKENTSRLFGGDICDLEKLTAAMVNYDVVFHLAANTNTRAGLTDLKLDLFNGLIGTYNVLLAMKANKVKKLVFTSTCGTYGDSPTPAVEDQLPTPICPYADHKRNAEILIKDFCAKNGIQVWVFRFGNAIGRVMSNGVIRDLVRKLKEDKTKLDVLGSKKPSRPFMSVEDCVDGVLWGFDHSNEPHQVFNIAGSGSTNIGKLVKMLLKEANLEIPVTFETNDRGWDGSAIEVEVNVDKIRKLGWEAKLSSDAAVKKAIKEIIEFQGLKV